MKIISDINLKVKKGEILGIVGESGSGKSTLLKSIMQIRETGVKVFKGEILFNGNSILNLLKKENRMMRGNHIGVIFQNPGASLNPTRKIKKQFEEHAAKEKTASELKKTLLELINDKLLLYVETMRMVDPDNYMFFAATVEQIIEEMNTVI